MPQPTEISTWIQEYFKANKQRTAQVLTGPKRETWFSAECFVALAGAGGPNAEMSKEGPLTYWGEREFAIFFASVEAPLREGDHKRKPDIVCSLPITGEEAIDTVVEVKLILNDEAPGGCVSELSGQMLNARQLFPGAKVLGVIFIAAAPLITPGTFSNRIRQAESCVDAALPHDRGFRWLSDQHFREIFAGVESGFAYPAMSVSLSMGILTLVAGSIGSASTPEIKGR
jgi:hypothetical protein